MKRAAWASMIVLTTILSFVESTQAIENIIVYSEEDKFCGWPANEGIWSWGNEIVVGFVVGEYLPDDPGHDCNLAGPLQMVQARSTDGGTTWNLETPAGLRRSVGTELDRSIEFTHADFAMKCRGDKFYYSYDRCRNWNGPFKFPQFGRLKLQARTDYIVNSNNECLIFITSDKPDDVEGQTFCIKTKDGGRNFDFVSWIAPCPPILAGPHVFSVQTASLRLSKTKLICGIRERRNKRDWIDVYASMDDGVSWQYLSRPVEMCNNPPSMLKLDDGRICLVYGDRTKPQGIYAKFSTDEGKTWTGRITLRDDGREWDLGYVRSVQRPDNKIVSVYYYTTRENKRQHMAATIWDPVQYSNLRAK